MKYAIRQYFPYSAYLSLQERLRNHRKEIVLFCDHPPTITAGIKTGSNSLKASREQLFQNKVEYIEIRRAGDLTAHEPGQIIIYPHTDLKIRQISFSAYFKSLLEITQKSILHTWKIQTRINTERPGLYSDSGAKIASIGIDLGRSFSSHGIAINAFNDLKTFELINPCGYNDLKIESLQNYGAMPERISKFREIWLSHFNQFIED